MNNNNEQSYEEQILEMVSRMSNKDNTEIAATILSIVKIDWDIFFKYLTPDDIESLDKYIKVNPLYERY